MTAEPRWVTRQMIDRAHDLEVRRNGGLAGIRDAGAIESALARPEQKWAYAKPDLADLAAAYGFGLAKNHGYLDGNKRAAFLAIGLFLGLNGQRLTATEPEAVTVMLGVASGELGEAELAVWIRRSVTPRAENAPR